jgi:hypothetical protein
MMKSRGMGCVKMAAGGKVKSPMPPMAPGKGPKAPKPMMPKAPAPGGKAMPFKKGGKVKGC